MDEHTATEIAYKNGYKAGYNQGVTDLAEKIKKYYSHLTGKTLPASVEYHIEQIKKDMLKGEG